LRYIHSCIDPKKIMNIPVKTADCVAMKHSEMPLSTHNVVTVMFGGQYNILKRLSFTVNYYITLFLMVDTSQSLIHRS